MQDIQRRYEELLARARAVGQEHVFRYWQELTASQKASLLTEVAGLDFERIKRLVRDCVVKATAFGLPKEIKPAPFYPAAPGDGRQEAFYRQAWEAGEQALRDGKVCAFTVAGGVGTRLGFDGPKGCYRIGPVTGKTLFQLFAEYLLHCRRRYRETIRWYIMTSRANHQATGDFFQANNYFGLPADAVGFFEQGMMPAFGPDGKLLLDQKYALALSPDGHGGSLRALRASGTLAEMKRLGIEHLSYFQVDNPLVRCLDPHFIGLHVLAGSEMSSKSVPKAEDKEKVGNFVVGDGKLMVIEYLDLPDRFAYAKDPDGSRTFDAGSIAIHAIARTFVERITEDDLQLPYHRAVKKVPYVNEQGRRVDPSEPNAVKLEQFVFDAIPLARNAIVVETVRKEEFSPVKSETGVDSAETARRDLIARASRWLERAGVSVALDPQTHQPFPIEISPLRAIFPDDLAR